MSWKIENNFVTGKPELVISGFENGIADSPYEGIADMRNVNITTSPKQASVQFATAAIITPPLGYTNTPFSSSAVTDIFTTASTAGFYEGMGLTIVTVSGGGSGTAGITYYVSDITATTFTLNNDLGLGVPLDITVDQTGTFSVSTFGTPADSVSANSNQFDSTTGENLKSTFVLTSDGLVWYIPPAGALMNTLQFTGNLLHSSANPGLIYGIVVFEGYLFAFMKQGIDYLPLANIINSTDNPSGFWVYDWRTAAPTFTGHRAIVGLDDVLYFCNGQAIGSVITTINKTFNPADSTTFTFNNNALTLPSYDSATCLAQLGTSLLIGGLLNYIYPWDRISTNFSYPIICAENYIACMVTMNSSTYVFAGNRGRIYITNGSNIQEFKKFPDALSGTVNPYYKWGWAIYWKDQLYFTISATDNASTVIPTFSGLWAIDIEDTNALRLTNSLSYGTYAGSVPTIASMGARLPTGDGIFSFWSNIVGGVDYTTSIPYANFEAIIDTDIIPVGTFLNQRNFTSVEFKLAKPLVDGEGIRLSWRANLTDDFTLMQTTTAIGSLAEPYLPNFSNIQWLQLRAAMKSSTVGGALSLSNFSAGLLIDLVRYYKLDGNSVDSIGGNNGVDTDITYSLDNGKILQGAGCNGTTSTIITSGTVSPTDFSIACWFKTSSSVPTIDFFSAVNGSTKFSLSMSEFGGVNTGKVNFFLRDSDGIEGDPTSTFTSNDGEFHYAVGTREGNVTRLYIDAQIVETTTQSFTGNFDNLSMTLGSTSGIYEGAVDEAGYWERALTLEEIEQLYNSTNPSYVPLMEIRLRE